MKHQSSESRGRFVARAEQGEQTGHAQKIRIPSNFQGSALKAILG